MKFASVLAIASIVALATSFDRASALATCTAEEAGTIASLKDELFLGETCIATMTTECPKNAKCDTVFEELATKMPDCSFDGLSSRATYEKLLTDCKPSSAGITATATGTATATITSAPSTSSASAVAICTQDENAKTVALANEVLTHKDCAAEVPKDPKCPSAKCLATTETITSQIPDCVTAAGQNRKAEMEKLIQGCKGSSAARRSFSTSVGAALATAVVAVAMFGV